MLAQELPHQVLPDGGPVEQSFAYHRFVLDLYWLAADFLERNELHACAGWKPRLLLGEAFLEACEIAPGVLPAIGDSDDGPDRERFEQKVLDELVDAGSVAGLDLGEAFKRLDDL